MTPPVDAWRIEHHRGSAEELHALEPQADDAPAVWVMEVVGAAVVLGSSQSSEVVDLRAVRRSAIEVARRRSGGGAVLLVPRATTWLDLIVPSSSSLWSDDIGIAASHAGELWAAALRELGQPCTTYPGPMQHTPWTRLACFAGLGPGEVHDGEGRKLVGISQRRTRGLARLQTVAHHDAEAVAATAGLLDLTPGQRLDLDQILRSHTAAVEAAPAALLAALTSQLPGG